MKLLFLVALVLGYFSCIGIAVDLLQEGHLVFGLILVLSPGLVVLGLWVTESMIQGIIYGSKKNSRNNN